VLAVPPPQEALALARVPALIRVQVDVVGVRVADGGLFGQVDADAVVRGDQANPVAGRLLLAGDGAIPR
jgi:hypothetical protein